ncbi:MAG: hypothetical protein ABIS92_07610 [Polyangia bacterium]
MNNIKLSSVVGAAICAIWLAAGQAFAEEATEEPGPATAERSPAPPASAAVTKDATGWEKSFYGFIELNGMHDTTQSFGPAANNTKLARPGTYAATHARSQMTVNNSQVGVRIAAPQFGSIKTSGQVEVDFFGIQPSDATEQTVFTTPSIRLRLFYLKLDTPVVDLLVGQYHELFGWGGAGFYQTSLAFLGVGGEIYHRNPQIRLSRTLGGSGSAVKVDLAVAAVRPVQRDGEVPDVQAGLKLAIEAWRGATAQGFGQPMVMPLSIGVSGVGRRFAVAEFLTNPGGARVAYGWGVAGNLFLPIIPTRSATDRSNALSITAQGSLGTGISDLYTGLTGGALFPLLPDPSGGQVPPPIYNPNIDSGIVTYDADGNLKTIDWLSAVVGLQYYLPIDGGRVWLSLTASHLESKNILKLTPEASRGGVFIRQDYADGNLFFAVTPAVQVALSGQVTEQTFGDFPFSGPHLKSRNYRSEIGFRLFF